MIGVSFLLAVMVVGQAAAPAALLQTHLKNERLGLVTSIRGLPLGVRDGLQKLFGGYSLDIAEPGARFQATGATVDPQLPTRRLVAAGCSTEHCLVYYERGGMDRTWHVALFHWTPDETRLEWGGIAPQGLGTIADVQRAALSGAIKGEARVW